MKKTKVDRKNQRHTGRHETVIGMVNTLQYNWDVMVFIGWCVKKLGGINESGTDQRLY